MQLCQFGFGHWQAIRLAIRRSPAFRFDYFLRCLPVELLQRRCEQLMKAAEKEVELLERQAREDAGLPVEAVNEGEELPSIELPKFRVIQAQQRKRSTERAAEERKKLEANVEELEAQIRAVKARLGELNEGSGIARVSPDNQESEGRGRDSMEPKEDQSSQVPESPELENEDGALGPDGEFVAFPEYDGSEEPPEWKKPFTHFCVHTRKQVKASLDPADRKDKVRLVLCRFLVDLQLDSDRFACRTRSIVSSRNSGRACQRKTSMCGVHGLNGTRSATRETYLYLRPSGRRRERSPGELLLRNRWNLNPLLRMTIFTFQRNESRARRTRHRCRRRRRGDAAD